MEVDWLKRIALGTPKAGRDTQPSRKSYVWRLFLGLLCLVVLRLWSGMLQRLRSVPRGALENQGV